MNTNSNVMVQGNLTLRIRIPESGNPTRILVMLHGWTGDENSMWIFADRLPERYLVLSPRGLFKTRLGGYSWQNVTDGGWPKGSDFDPAIKVILDMVDNLDVSKEIQKDVFDVMGFSQGAALAYAMAVSHPGRIGKLAGLSGFFPEGLENKIAAKPFDGKKVFVAHGQKDELVPIWKARIVVESLTTAGAEVAYCEEDVGHKLSAGCFRGLGVYFAN